MPNTPFSNYSLDKVPQELYLFYGGQAGGEVDNFDPLADSFFAQRIPEKNKRLVTKKNIWQANKTYKHYSSTNDYDVVWNDENGVVYMCLHNNSNFRDDTEDGEPGLSTVKPTHTGKATLADGYTWLSLWKVDFIDYDFINDTEIPIPNVEITNTYNTFIEKYEPLCGTEGTTTFGCCCLYFKDNSTDEVTGEVYTQGDLTNEVIFSDCFECQKLADALDREVLFLAGVTVGGVTDAHPPENPLCPATKTIQTLQEQLQDNVYNIIPGSAQDFQLNLLNSHNKQGIMGVALDLSGLSETDRSISVSNPTIRINDATGSGGYATLKTTPVGLDKHYVYGIQLTSEGSGYSLLPTVSSTGVSTTILNAIKIYPYPKGVYEDLQTFTPATGFRILNSITNKQIATVLPSSTIPIYKVAVAANPKELLTDTPLVKPKNDETVSTLLTRLFAFDPNNFQAGVFPPEAGPGNQEQNEADTIDNAVQDTESEYEISVVYAASATKAVEYEGMSGSASGYNLQINDDPTSVREGQVIGISGGQYIVYSVTPPTINTKTAKYYNTIDFSNDPIEITGAANQTTTKSYTFNIKLKN